MILETERLIIREFKPDDIKDVQVYASAPLVVKHMIWGPNSEDETRSFINGAIEMQQQETRRNFEFAVVLKVSNQLIGGCGIHICEPKQGESRIL